MLVFKIWAIVLTFGNIEFAVATNRTIDASTLHHVNKSSLSRSVILAYKPTLVTLAPFKFNFSEQFKYSEDISANKDISKELSIRNPLSFLHGSHSLSELQQANMKYLSGNISKPVKLNVIGLNSTTEKISYLGHLKTNVSNKYIALQRMPKDPKCSTPNCSQPSLKSQEIRGNPLSIAFEMGSVKSNQSMRKSRSNEEFLEHQRTKTPMLKFYNGTTTTPKVVENKTEIMVTEDPDEDIEISSDELQKLQKQSKETLFSSDENNKTTATEQQVQEVQEVPTQSVLETSEKSGRRFYGIGYPPVAYPIEYHWYMDDGPDPNTYTSIWWTTRSYPNSKTDFLERERKQQVRVVQSIPKTYFGKSWEPPCYRQCTDSKNEEEDRRRTKREAAKDGSRKTEAIHILTEQFNENTYSARNPDSFPSISSRSGPQKIPNEIQELSLSGELGIKPNTFIENFQLKDDTRTFDEPPLPKVSQQGKFEEYFPLLNRELKVKVYDLEKKLHFHFADLQKSSTKMQIEFRKIINKNMANNYQLISLVHSMNEKVIKTAVKSIHQACGMMLASVDTSLNKLASTITYTDNQIIKFLSQMETCLRLKGITQMPVQINDQLIKCSEGKIDFIALQIDQIIKNFAVPQVFFTTLPKHFMSCLNYYHGPDGEYKLRTIPLYAPLPGSRAYDSTSYDIETDESALCLSQALNYVGQKSLEISSDIINIGFKISDIIWTLDSGWNTCINDKIKMVKSTFEEKGITLENCSMNVQKNVTVNK